MMPSAIARPPLSLQSSFSYSITAPSSISETRWTPHIQSAIIISFEKRSDQKIWYIAKITPLQQPYNSYIKPYLIARRYEDFAQLSQNLHDRFSTIKHRASFQLPPKIKSTRLNLLASSKQIYTQRINELNEYMALLFRNPPLITESPIVLDFFDISTQDLKYQDSKQEVEDVGEEDTLVDDDAKSDMKGSNVSRWKRLRCTSFLARAPQPSATLSSLCSQAASKIIPSRHRPAVSVLQPSISTPTSHANASASNAYRNTNTSKEKLKKSKSSVCVGSALYEHNKSVASSISSAWEVPSPSSSKQLKDTIKIKVIYDSNNIIVVQVPRTIGLEELRSRIAEKFSDQFPQNEIVLLYSDSMRSYCSTNSEVSLPAILINKEQDLAHIMHTKWNRLEKVTLRCIM